MECYVQHPRGSTRGIKYTIFMDIVSLKVICRKPDVLKLVECVCDCLFWTDLKMLSPETFIVRLSVERVQSSAFPQLSSSPRLRPLGRRPRESRLRQHAAALGGSQRPRRGCGAFALQRRRGRRQEQRWPGASKREAGRRNRVSDLGHLRRFFVLEIHGFCVPWRLSISKDCSISLSMLLYCWT